MSVVSVTALSSNGGGTRKERKYTATYRVVTDDRLDGPNTARGAIGIPDYGAAYSFGNDGDDYAFCTEKTATTQDEGSSLKNWIVTCTYSTEEKKWCGDSQYDNPLDEPPQISGSLTTFSKVIDKDTDGRAIASSAGEPFDPPLEIDNHRPVIHIVRNESSTDFDLNLLNSYIDTTNNSTFWGLSAGKVKFSNFTWEIKFLGTCSEWYATVAYDLEVKWDGWDEVLLDRGFYEIVDNKRKTILDDREDDEGGPRYVNQPVWLDGNGRKLEPGTGGEYTPVALPAFKIYERKDFDALGLPSL